MRKGSRIDQTKFELNRWNLWLREEKKRVEAGRKLDGDLPEKRQVTMQLERREVKC